METYIVWTAGTNSRGGWKIEKAETPQEIVDREQAAGLVEVFLFPERRASPPCFSRPHYYWAQSALGDHGKFVPDWVFLRLLEKMGAVCIIGPKESPMRTVDEWHKSSEGPTHDEVSDEDTCYVTTVRVTTARISGKQARLLAGMKAIYAWAIDGPPLAPLAPF